MVEAKAEEKVKEIWDYEEVIMDMLKFCIHTRHQTEKMEQELRRIWGEMQEKKVVVDGVSNKGL